MSDDAVGKLRALASRWKAEGDELKTSRSMAVTLQSLIFEIEAERTRMLEPFDAIVEKFRNMKVMAEAHNASGFVETPQGEWTPYEGKILAYGYCITELESALRSARGGQ